MGKSVKLFIGTFDSIEGHAGYLMNHIGLVSISVSDPDSYGYYRFEPLCPPKDAVHEFARSHHTKEDRRTLKRWYKHKLCKVNPDRMQHQLYSLFKYYGQVLLLYKDNKVSNMCADVFRAWCKHMDIELNEWSGGET